LSARGGRPNWRPIKKKRRAQLQEKKRGPSIWYREKGWGAKRPVRGKRNVLDGKEVFPDKSCLIVQTLWSQNPFQTVTRNGTDGGAKTEVQWDSRGGRGGCRKRAKQRRDSTARTRGKQIDHGGERLAGFISTSLGPDALPLSP